MKEHVLEFEKPLIELETKIEELKRMSLQKDLDLIDVIKSLEEKANNLTRDIFSSLTPWERTAVARHKNRPQMLHYVGSIFTDFIELHGDRCFSDDAAIVSGLAKLDGQPVAVIGHQKGTDTKENLRRNFGMASPEGFRKACRVMRLAEKLSLPLVTFINTPGAYPGVGAEERGQSEAIAQSLKLMAGLQVPIIVVIIGEGGSGGALAIGVGDRILMLEHSIYTVISPEGCASILWRDSSLAPKAAEQLKITAPDLLQLNIIDEIILEPLGGAHRHYEIIFQTLKESLKRNLDELKVIPLKKLLDKRYQKFRKMGVFLCEEPKSLQH